MISRAVLPNNYDDIGLLFKNKRIKRYLKKGSKKDQIGQDYEYVKKKPLYYREDVS